MRWNLKRDSQKPGRVHDPVSTRQGRMTMVVDMTIQTGGAIICTDKNWLPGPEKLTISGISFGLVFALVKNIEVRT